jgi:Cof subfamily protein (haloacid dehalogenase superfamily)
MGESLEAKALGRPLFEETLSGYLPALSIYDRASVLSRDSVVYSLVPYTVRGEEVFPVNGPWRMLALDLDGTLLNDQLAVDPRDRAALERVRQKGVEVTLLTGRMLPSVKPYLEKLQITAPVVLYNGTIIHDPRFGHETIMGRLPSRLASQLIGLAAHHPVDAQLYIGPELLIGRETPAQREFLERERLSAREVGDLAAAVSDDPLKLLFIGEPGVLDGLEGRWGRLVAGEARLVRSQPVYLECLPPNVNKGIALKVLVGSLNIPMKEVIAVGDQPNDVEMLREAGLGVAVANAHPTCLEAADVVLDRTNNEAAVEELVARYLY